MALTLSAYARDAATFETESGLETFASASASAAVDAGPGPREPRTNRERDAPTAFGEPVFDASSGVGGRGLARPRLGNHRGPRRRLPPRHPYRIRLVYVDARRRSGNDGGFRQPPATRPAASRRSTSARSCGTRSEGADACQGPRRLHPRGGGSVRRIRRRVGGGSRRRTRAARRQGDRRVHRATTSRRGVGPRGSGRWRGRWRDGRRGSSEPAGADGGRLRPVGMLATSSSTTCPTRRRGGCRGVERSRPNGCAGADGSGKRGRRGELRRRRGQTDRGWTSRWRAQPGRRRAAEAREGRRRMERPRRRRRRREGKGGGGGARADEFVFPREAGAEAHGASSAVQHRGSHRGARADVIEGLVRFRKPSPAVT